MAHLQALQLLRQTFRDFRRSNVPDTFHGMPWPKTVPDDLRRKLEAVLGYRNRPEPQDVWGAVLEWLESKGIAMPSDGDGKP
jgi:hypothetical protein